MIGLIGANRKVMGSLQDDLTIHGHCPAGVGTNQAEVGANFTAIDLAPV